MGEFSISHILLVLIIVLIFFGPSRLPQLGQSLGKAIRGFKQGLNNAEAEAEEIKNEALSKPVNDGQVKSTENANKKEKV
jgi:sec-independent protein translocase protein TatA